MLCNISCYHHKRKLGFCVFQHYCYMYCVNLRPCSYVLHGRSVAFCVFTELLLYFLLLLQEGVGGRYKSNRVLHGRSVVCVCFY